MLFSQTPCYKLVTEFEEVRNLTAHELILALGERLDTEEYTLNIICSVLRLHLLGETYRKVTCSLSRNRVVGLNLTGETIMTTRFSNVSGDTVTFKHGRFLDEQGASYLTHSPKGYPHSIAGTVYLILKSDLPLLGKKFL